MCQAVLTTALRRRGRDELRLLAELDESADRDPDDSAYPPSSPCRTR